MVKISEESEQKEFIVSKGSEFARVGRKGIIFKLSTETLLLTFASDEVCLNLIFLSEVFVKFFLLRIPTSSPMR